MGETPRALLPSIFYFLIVLYEYREMKTEGKNQASC